MEVLERHQDLGGVEADGFEWQAVGGLFGEQGVEVAVGAVVDEEAGVVGDFDVGVESGEERVVEEREDLGFGLDLGEFLGGQGVAIDDFQGELGVVVVVAEAAEEDTAEVAGAEVADEFEVAEVDGAGGGEGGGGLDGGPVGVGLAVGAFVEGG